MYHMTDKTEIDGLSPLQWMLHIWNFAGILTHKMEIENPILASIDQIFMKLPIDQYFGA